MSEQTARFTPEGLPIIEEVMVKGFIMTELLFKEGGPKGSSETAPIHLVVFNAMLKDKYPFICDYALKLSPERSIQYRGGVNYGIVFPFYTLNLQAIHLGKQGIRYNLPPVSEHTCSSLVELLNDPSKAEEARKGIEDNLKQHNPLVLLGLRTLRGKVDYNEGLRDGTLFAYESFRKAAELEPIISDTERTIFLTGVAERMNVSQPRFYRVLGSARKKIADIIRFLKAYK